MKLRLPIFLEPEQMLEEDASYVRPKLRRPYSMESSTQAGREQRKVGFVAVSLHSGLPPLLLSAKVNTASAMGREEAHGRW